MNFDHILLLLDDMPITTPSPMADNPISEILVNKVYNEWKALGDIPLPTLPSPLQSPSPMVISKNQEDITEEATIDPSKITPIKVIHVQNVQGGIPDFQIKGRAQIFSLLNRIIEGAWGFSDPPESIAQTLPRKEKVKLSQI